MSQLDNILEGLDLAIRLNGRWSEEMQEPVKQQIKALMLDLIDSTGVYRSEIGHWTVDSEKLKKKVEEL